MTREGPRGSVNAGRGYPGSFKLSVDRGKLARRSHTCAVPSPREVRERGTLQVRLLLASCPLFTNNLETGSPRVSSPRVRAPTWTLSGHRLRRLTPPASSRILVNTVHSELPSFIAADATGRQPHPPQPPSASLSHTSTVAGHRGTSRQFPLLLGFLVNLLAAVSVRHQLRRFHVQLRPTDHDENAMHALQESPGKKKKNPKPHSIAETWAGK